MSFSISAASPSSAYAGPSLTPTIDEILAQNAAADAQAAPAELAPPLDPAQGNNLDISV
ncbi:MAG: hypothetical protein WCO83_06060 [Alphaproteobacteria bacterium]